MNTYKVSDKSLLTLFIVSSLFFNHFAHASDRKKTAPYDTSGPIKTKDILLKDVYPDLSKLLDSVPRLEKPIDTPERFNDAIVMILHSSYISKKSRALDKTTRKLTLEKATNVWRIMKANQHLFFKNTLQFSINDLPKEFVLRSKFTRFGLASFDPLLKCLGLDSLQFNPLSDSRTEAMMAHMGMADISQGLQTYTDNPKPRIYKTISVNDFNDSFKVMLNDHVEQFLLYINTRLQGPIKDPFIFAIDTFYAFMCISPIKSENLVHANLEIANLITNFILMKFGYMPLFFSLYDHKFTAQFLSQMVEIANSSRDIYRQYNAEGLFNNEKNIPLWTLAAKHMKNLHQRVLLLDHQCIACGRTATTGKETIMEVDKTLKKCSRCKIAYYCSPECQKTHWPEHKLVCKKSSGDDQKDSQKAEQKSDKASPHEGKSETKSDSKSNTLSSSSSAAPATNTVTSSNNTPPSTAGSTRKKKTRKKWKEKQKDKAGNATTSNEGNDEDATPDPDIDSIQ